MSNESTPVNGAHLEGGEGVYRYLTTEEPIARKDLTIKGATFAGLLAYIRSRKEVILALKDETHITANAATGDVVLCIHEHGGYREGGDYVPETRINAALEQSADFTRVRTIVNTTFRSPHDAFEVLRQVPHLFAWADEHAETLKALRSQTFSLRKLIADTSSDSGEREKRLRLSFEEQPPRIAFRFLVPIHNGEDRVEIEVDALYEANAELNGVNLKLVNYRLDGIVQAAREASLRKAITDIEAELGVDAIPVIAMN